MMKKLGVFILGLAVKVCPLLIEKRYPMYYNGKFAYYAHEVEGIYKWLH